MIGWIMPRKGTVERREVDNDPVFANQMVQKLINCLTYDGKRSVSQGIVYDSFEMIRQRANDDPLKVFKKAVENIRPALEVKSRRVGGANYQVPVEVNRNRQSSLSLRWLIGYARQRSEKSMVEKLAAELMDAANNKGGAIKKRDDTHRMAEANKAFAHYRW
jgi:small subunit ribosomal protein S7